MKNRKRKLRGKKLKKQRVTIVLIILFATLFLSAGYAAFQTIISINVKGNTKAIDNLYVSNSGSDTEGDGTISNPYKTIQKAYNEASKVAKIYIMNDISLVSTIDINSNKKITLTSYIIGDDEKHSVFRTESTKGNLINQTAGNLTLKDIIIDGNNINGNTYMIESSSILYLKDNAIIKNAYNESGTGGIRITEQGKLYVSGGEISNNIAAYSPSIECVGYCEMTDGKISDNKCIGSGCAGAGIAVNGSFNMNGGEIKNNTSINAAGGLYVYRNGYAVINNGIISNNNAINGGGIYLYNNATLTINGGIIRNNMANNNGGIGKQNTTTLIYNSGIICGNTPSNEYETHEVCPN